MGEPEHEFDVFGEAADPLQQIGAESGPVNKEAIRQHLARAASIGSGLREKLAAMQEDLMKRLREIKDNQGGEQ